MKERDGERETIERTRYKRLGQLKDRDMTGKERKKRIVRQQERNGARNISIRFI